MADGGFGTCPVCDGAIETVGRYTYSADSGAEYDVHVDCWLDAIGSPPRRDVGTALAYHAASHEPTFPEAARRLNALAAGHDPALVLDAEVRLALEHMESAVEDAG